MLILILAVIALILAAIDEFNAAGRSLISWGVIALATIEIIQNSGKLV